LPAILSASSENPLYPIAFVSVEGYVTPDRVFSRVMPRCNDRRRKTHPAFSSGVQMKSEHGCLRVKSDLDRVKALFSLGSPHGRVLLLKNDSKFGSVMDAVESPIDGLRYFIAPFVRDDVDTSDFRALASNPDRMQFRMQRSKSS
jgi:hypothetical protein